MTDIIKANKIHTDQPQNSVKSIVQTLQVQAESYHKYMRDPMDEYNDRQKDIEETGSYIIGNIRIIQDQRKYSKYLKAQRKNKTQSV